MPPTLYFAFSKTVHKSHRIFSTLLRILQRHKTQGKIIWGIVQNMFIF